ncbi:UNVERIFIED_CONTAM: hypothetical protein K2H54_056248 [Gekko kuhli]
MNPISSSSASRNTGRDPPLLGNSHHSDSFSIAGKQSTHLSVQHKNAMSHIPHAQQGLPCGERSVVRWVEKMILEQYSGGYIRSFLMKLLAQARDGELRVSLNNPLQKDTWFFVSFSFRQVLQRHSSQIVPVV